MSEFAAFCPLMCAVTMETGALAGTTEMAMLWLGGLMRESGLAGVPTGQLLTASFCHAQEEGDGEKGYGRKEKVTPLSSHICNTTKGTYRRQRFEIKKKTVFPVCRRAERHEDTPALAILDHLLHETLE